MSVLKFWPITENDVYVRVFDEILNEIDTLFVDLDLVQNYRALRPECRYMLTRTYIRAAKWIRKEQFEKYMAAETVERVFGELKCSGWFLDDPPLKCLISDVASQQELREVARTLGLKNAANMNRNKLAEELIQMDKQQSFFNPGKSFTKINDSLQIKCFLLNPVRRSFFFKLEQLFLYPVGPDASLEVIFLTHMKKHSFYKYKYLTQREAPLFNSAESFDAYAEARRLCNPIEEALSLTQPKIMSRIISQDVMDQIESGLQCAVINNHSQAAYCYARNLYNISQVLMKAHRYIDEYTWIQKYLDQGVHKRKRGVSLIRKLQLELRFLEESQTNGESSWLVGALNTYYDAVSEVTEIEMLDLQRKFVKLVSSIRNSGLKSALPLVQQTALQSLVRPKIPVFEIIAVPSKAAAGSAVLGPGTRVMYGEGIGVEQLALLHYEGYKGGHYENSMMITIFWLLCYDFMFSDPSQFRCAYQSRPLEVQSIINSNKVQILERMKDDATKSVLNNRRKLLKEFGDIKPLMGGINWAITEENISAVMRGLGDTKLQAILSRLMENYHKYSSGFPDLTIWNKEENRLKFVEVKSENDTVSDNQLVWMEFLLQNEVDVEICKVISEKRPTKRKRA